MLSTAHEFMTSEVPWTAHQGQRQGRSRSGAPAMANAELAAPHVTRGRFNHAPGEPDNDGSTRLPCQCDICYVTMNDHLNHQLKEAILITPAINQSFATPINSS